MFARSGSSFRWRWVIGCALLAGLISWYAVGKGGAAQQGPKGLFKCVSPACGHVFEAKPELGQMNCPRCGGPSRPCVECPQCGQRVIPNGYLGRPEKTYCPQCGTLLVQPE